MKARDLDQYLERIGLDCRPSPDAEGLARIQRAHRLSIPFENLDILLGRSITLDPDAVFAKLVMRKRGGYCFEQNQLFGRALAELGLDVRALLGRVWLFAGEGIPPRTHTLNLVTLAQELWIADAGFGASYAPPMKLADGVEVTGEDGAVHRLRADTGGGWMFERQTTSGFVPQYGFTLDPVAPVDLEMSNHWTSTWKGSRFVNEVIASLILPQGLSTLANCCHTRIGPSGKVVDEITSPLLLQTRLADAFGIILTIDEVEALPLWNEAS